MVEEDKKNFTRTPCTLCEYNTNFQSNSLSKEKSVKSMLSILRSSNPEKCNLEYLWMTTSYPLTFSMTISV